MSLDGIPPNSSPPYIDQKDRIIKILSSMNGELSQIISVLSADITKANTINISNQNEISKLIGKCDMVLNENEVLEHCLDCSESMLDDLRAEYEILELTYMSLTEGESEIFLGENSTASIGESTELEKLKLENEELKKKFICRVCYLNDIDIILNACGHVLICKQCLECLIQMNTTHDLSTHCPLCNEVVSSYSPLYLPN
tara:strand:- start:9454 stop:10053 length:600 start_codon:yes stop_codon:yes gene_type:complete